MPRTPFAALALTAVILTAAGCGGSSKTTSTETSAAATAPTTSTTGATTQATATVAAKPASGKPLTRAEWISKGDAICAHLNTQLDATPIKTVAEFARVLPQAVLYERAALAQLSTLVPPPSEASNWRHILTNVAEWANDSAKVGVEAQSSNFSLTSPAMRATRVYHEGFAHLSKRSGFKQCSVV